MLVITLKDNESFRVAHEGVEIWITLKKHNGKIRVFVDLPKGFQVLRKDLVTEEAATAVE